MNTLSPATRREASVLYAQLTLRLAGYEHLDLELDEREHKYLVRIYLQGAGGPCDGAVFIRPKNLELLDFVEQMWQGIQDILKRR